MFLLYIFNNYYLIVFILFSSNQKDLKLLNYYILCVSRVIFFLDLEFCRVFQQNPIVLKIHIIYYYLHFFDD